MSIIPTTNTVHLEYSLYSTQCEQKVVVQQETAPINPAVDFAITYRDSIKRMISAVERALSVT
ncbi:hypothetical protein EBT25_05830 [bacterium]|nr:hypothetical protein [bacterium]